METKVLEVNETLKGEFFAHLLSSAKCDNCTLECIGFTSKWNNYSISFYASANDNFTVIVEDFGRMVKKAWQQLEPTAEQVQAMQELINSKINDAEPFETTDANDYPERDDYHFYQLINGY